MIVQTYDIDVDYTACGVDIPKVPPTLTGYLIENNDLCYLKRKRPAVIICPGGGYGSRAYHEGEPVAVRFNSVGIQAFVLNYSVAPMRFPGSLMELATAVAQVRAISKEYNIDPNRIVVCGFSAGGHLAASLGVYWHEPFVQRVLGYDNNENQPNGLILAYPVITNKKGIAHLGSIQCLLGKYPDEKELALFALEDNVNCFVPPTFLWHAYDDTAVPLENSLLFATALKAQDILTEFHVYPKGGHGCSLANEVTATHLGQIVPCCQNWIDMAIRFVEEL